MPVGPGQSLLHYRIVEKIGEGGMGVVWKASDTRLGREVAIKLLPEAFGADPQRLTRLRREARAMALLNHPNIVTIHGVEQADETVFLVLEYVRGTPLTSLIPPEGLPAKRLFDLAVPLAEGLAEAHRQGVTHRDLKPGNVIVTEDGRPKILDFGLAKLIESDRPAETTHVPEDLTQSGTATTAAGSVLGTAAYMSPEQIDGQTADARSDIFSFGVMLYEMATGHRPFGGKTPARVMSAILTEQPRPLGGIRPDLPEHLGRIVQQCLEKDPERRFQTATDVRNQLQTLRDELFLATAVVESGPRPMRWIVAALAGIAAAVLGFWYFSGHRGDDAGSATDAAIIDPSPFATRSLSQLTFDAATERWPTWSPDGTQLVYGMERDGYSNLFLEDVATKDVRRLTSGAHDDIQPAWSHDGRSILFVRSNTERGTLEPTEALTGIYTGGDVWRLELETDNEQRIIDDAYNPVFSPDGTRIAVDASWAGPRRIWTTDSRGRNPRQITSGASEAIEHTNPAWAPDGTGLVYQHAEKTKQDIHAIEIATGRTVPVTDDLYLDLDPVWSASGRHVLMASKRAGGLNIWRVPVGSGGRPTGSPEQLTTGAGQDIQPALAPDGSTVAFTVLSQNADLWRLPVDPMTGEATGPVESMVESTREDSRGAWSPDGTRLAFNSDRGGEMNLWVHDLTDDTTRQITRGPGGDYQPSWSPDGRQIAFFSARSGNADIWIADVESAELRQLTDHAALDTNPFFSPDGGRIVFQSDRDGRKEVWLVNVDGNDVRQLATVGAADHFMRWSDDDRYVYFRSSALPDNGVCRVSVDGGAAEPLGIPVGWHMSFSPDRSLILDAVGHKGLWVYPVDGSARREVFVSDDPDVRVDYPQWSPDGRWVVFDRVVPRGGDVWLLEGLR